MPISEDEFDHHLPHRPQHHVGMSKAEQRRSNKPIMEKRRRARINHCLNELKTLILDAMKKDPARHSKLEKADILEMTVKHLQTIQRQQLAVAVATDPGVLHKFKNGFNECATEVSRYIGRIEGVEPGIKQRLVSHLANCVTSLQQLSPFTFPPPTTSTVYPTTTLHIQPTVTAPASTTTTGLPTILPQIPTSANVASGDVNNNTPPTRLQMAGGLQLIPSRLPTGELALLVPNSGQLPGNVLPFFPPPPTNPSTNTGTAVTSSSSTNSSVTSTSTTSNPPPVPPTSTSIVADGSHPSAFTAVGGARSQSPTTTTSITTTAQTLQQQLQQQQQQHQQQQQQHQPHQPQPLAIMQNLTASKMMTVLTSSTPPPLSTSPASSVSSCETTDTYGPSTPPPQSAQTHSTFSSSLGHFKVPLGSPSSAAGFKVFHFPVLDNQKPHQQPLVTSSTSPPDAITRFEPTDSLAHNPTSLQYQQPIPASSASGVVAAELKLAFKTLPTFEQSSPKLLTTVSQPVMTAVSGFQSLADGHPTPTSAPTTVVTATTAAPTFILPDQLQLSNPPLDFSIKKEPLTVSTPIQSSVQVSGKRTYPEAGNSVTCSPSKMLRLSFVQSPPPQQALPHLHKPENDGAPVGLLKLYSPPPPAVNPKCTSQLSVVVEDLSNKPSSSAEVANNNSASAQSQANKDMWRPW